MRKFVVFMAASILLVSLGALIGAPQTIPGRDPQYQRNNPQTRGIDPRLGDRRTFVGQLSAELVRQAAYLANTSYEYFMGWNGMITDREQAVLFKTEEFSAACRLFSKLASDRTDYFRRESVRTNLYSASRYVAVSFRQLEEQMRLGGFQGDFNRNRRDGRPFQQRPGQGTIGSRGLVECRRIINQIEREFTNWR
jgi:hypothetical protein